MCDTPLTLRRDLQTEVPLPLAGPWILVDHVHVVASVQTDEVARMYVECTQTTTSGNRDSGLKSNLCDLSTGVFKSPAST